MAWPKGMPWHSRTSGRTRPCRWCGTGFISYKKNHLFCSDSCKSRYHGAGKTKRALYVARVYGLSHAEYEAMLAAQQHCCAICSCEIGKSVGDVSIDHDHGTGKVRGLLCRSCNVGIGQLSDDVHTVQVAADYLARYAPDADVLEVAF